MCPIRAGTLVACALSKAMHRKTLLDIVKRTGEAWMEDKASRLAASLAFYTLLSVAPLLVLLVSMLGLFYGDEAARGEVASQLVAALGHEASRGIEALIAEARVPAHGVLGTVAGVVVLLFGASGVFGELQSSLNTVWEIEPKKGRGIVGVIKDRFFSFTMVLGVGFLLLVSLVLSTVLSALGSSITPDAPGLSVLFQLVNALISFAFVTALFALMYRVIPDVRIAWRDVFMGAAVTALLFTLGKFLLGLYLGRASVSSPYGAAGSLVVFILWVYYSAQILFLGAEFTQVYATTLGSRILPDEDAVSTAHANDLDPHAT
jgi:membrane protein